MSHFLNFSRSSGGRYTGRGCSPVFRGRSPPAPASPDRHASPCRLRP